MPQLLIKGISTNDICKISKPLIEELANVCECGTDNFTIDCIHSTSIFDGEVVDSFPFIEVKWFERGVDTRDRFAATIEKHVNLLNIPEFEIAFITYKEDSYYINGKRFE
ncbi:hypothetical protein CN692_18235 [Bacillus sp. AFS002410]|uniref:DUF1904 family protein n=1 Tax=Bacillus sp. AFS002410 TaxID=2033481 RepID=UPI000BF04890|nr:DUF1904 family protein [Bacillus sp. AFS002410]PEJ56275.1 hypothetical protein CN692_18235 [Bacillus sp. AFS002410]